MMFMGNFPGAIRPFAAALLRCGSTKELAESNTPRLRGGLT